MKQNVTALAIVYVVLSSFFELFALYHWWVVHDWQATVLDLLWWIGLSLTFLLAVVADWLQRHP